MSTPDEKGGQGEGRGEGRTIQTRTRVRTRVQTKARTTVPVKIYPSTEEFHSVMTCSYTWTVDPHQHTTCSMIGKSKKKSHMIFYPTVTVASQSIIMTSRHYDVTS
jgi:hypothetical protein